MVRVLLAFCFAITVAQEAYAQGTASTCVDFVGLDCLDISNTGGRCIDTGPGLSHNCVFDAQTITWGCDPATGVDMVDNSPYSVAVPVAPFYQGYSAYIHVSGDPCGFMETCACDAVFFYCYDAARTPWGPGDDIPDPSVFGIPPQKDCWGGMNP